MPHSVRVLLLWIAVGLAYDLTLHIRLIPYPTLSEDLRGFAASHPVLWPALYWSIALLLYLHFRSST